ncbi:MAG: cardiolipin synthase [Bdellovibrionaceae bacterium]|nr:cardiolipin synthase [Pseudobdellovibrionaceae bacterium]
MIAFITEIDNSIIFYIVFIVLQLIFIARVILRPHRQPASRIAWIAVISVLPVFGIFIYVLFGETNIGDKKTHRMRKIISSLPKLILNESDQKQIDIEIPESYQQLFNTANSISGFGTLGGNTAKLFSCSNKSIDSMVQDIDKATDHVHVLFYIWLPDNNGIKMIDAIKRAVSRGVKCRIMVDNLGSRTLIKSKYWQSLKEAGARVSIALPIGNIFLKPFKGRIDLRNHRKIVVIDNYISYCGSQNCADPEFLVKVKYAPWVDAVVRFEGPIAAQQQRLFASDWLANENEDLSSILNIPINFSQNGVLAQAFGTGPTVRYSAMPEMFESLFFMAQKKITITTPYYVPDESLQNAICSAALRGVETTVIFPARNDSFVVAAASRSYYLSLLESGVKIYEYVGGLLHTKSVTLDEQISMIGSANMDRRSFDLNYENNILLYDRKLTSDLQILQNHYISKSNSISIESVKTWSWTRRLWNNSIAMMGPLL